MLLLMAGEPDPDSMLLQLPLMLRDHPTNIPGPTERVRGRGRDAGVPGAGSGRASVGICKSSPASSCPFPSHRSEIPGNLYNLAELFCFMLAYPW